MHRFSHAAEAEFVIFVTLQEIEPRPAFGDGACWISSASNTQPGLSCGLADVS